MSLTDCGTINLLLEQDGAESGVEGTNTLLLQHAGHGREQTAGEGGLGDKTDTGGLKRAQGDIGNELGGTGGGEVDSGAVVLGSLVAKGVDGLLLEELVSTELEGTLEEVTGGGRTETSQESASTLVLDDLAEATEHAAVVGDGVKLDTGLDTIDEAGYEREILRASDSFTSKHLHIKGSGSAVGDGAAHGTSEGEASVLYHASQLEGIERRFRQ